MKYLLKNIAAIQQRIKDTCKKNSLYKENIKIVFVSKNATAEQMAFIYNNLFLPNQKNINLIFGENRMPDAEKRKEQFYKLITQKQKIQWHFIGYLQSNKLNKILPFADMIQSIDRLEIAQKIHQKNKMNSNKKDILIQINTSEEENKSGFKIETAIEKIKELATKYDSLNIKGLMTIGPQDRDIQKTRNCFRQLKSIYEKIKKFQKGFKNIEMNILSMGMSNDLEIAIEEGSNMIRIGSDIFQRK